MLTNPSKFVEVGFYYAQPILEYLKNSGVSASTALSSMLGSLGSLIMLCFVIMSIQVFLTYLEFYIVGALALILIPFGALQRTAFIAEKAIGAVIAFGIKIMILNFIIAVAFPLLSQVAVDAGQKNPAVDENIKLFTACLGLTLLMWHAPNVATSLLSGSPSLGASSLMGFLGGSIAGRSGGQTFGGSGGINKTEEAAKVRGEGVNTNTGVNVGGSNIKKGS